MRVHYARSKFLLYKLALPIGVGVYAVALMSALPLWPWLAAVLAIVALAAQIAVFVIRVFALEAYDVAEGVRRTAMLQDSLGIAPSPLQLARLQERTAGAPAAAPPLLAPYYASTEP